MKIFISGIDTDSGKTIITGLLAKYIQSINKTVITQKYVQTGCTDIAEDLLMHRKIMNSPVLAADKAGITCSYLFKHPASPHLSAKMEGISIDPEKFTVATKELYKSYNYVLMEGAGGLMVPLISETLLIDYVKKHNYPVILVSSSKLGSINHTLLSLEALKSRNIDVIGLVYNQYPNDDELITKDSEQTIKQLLKLYFPECPFITIPEIDVNKPHNIDFSSIFTK